MILEKLGSSLKKATDKIANAVFLDKSLVDSVVRDLQRALIEADVNIQLVKEISEKIKQSALDERIKGIEKKEHIIKLMHDSLIKILGKGREVELGKKNVWLFVGLYGAGKTTTIGKIGAYYSKRGKKVCAVGLDVHRPAAMEQLKQVCANVKIDCFVDANASDALVVWKEFKEKTKDYDLVLVDSAGRDALDADLIKEIKSVGKLVGASERFLVIQADIGQTAKKQAAAFKEAVGITGVVITRMDSTAKGGGALTACAEAGVGVVWIGVGEKPVDLELFEPEGFLSRMLGMGDLKALMDKIHSVVDAKDIKAAQARLAEGKFTMDDFKTQLDSMGQLGSFDKIMGMVPGMSKIKEKVGEDVLESQQEKTKRWKYCIESMTPAERENPSLLEKETSRIQRIAHGSGCTTSDVRALLKQFKMLKELIGMQSGLAEGGIDNKMMMKLARKFGKKMRF